MATAIVSKANLVVTYSASGVQITAASNPSIYTFDTLSSGLQTNVTWTGIGSFDKLWIQSADQYGGAGGTGKYAVVGAEASSASLLSTTLTLNTPEGYLGLWLSAGDAQNLITLYQGTTQLAAFNVGTLLSAIGACSGSNAYCGNPNGGQDSGEPFAYLNFFGTNGTNITKVTFSNANYSTGFEYDNVAVAGAQSSITGTVLTTYTATPEPATMLMIGGGLLFLGGLARRMGRRG
jgi:hypothetical protein